MWVKLDNGQLVNLDLVTDIWKGEARYIMHLVGDKGITISVSEYERIQTILHKEKKLSVS